MKISFTKVEKIILEWGFLKMELIIKEVIVVEGKNDTNIIKKYLKCDTIETNGSALSEQVLSQIKLAKERRGVIIFTDPDYVGEKIRKTIDRTVPGCKHAFLTKKDAVDLRKKKVGVEHATRENIIEAIQQARPTMSDCERSLEITREDLFQAGLLAGEGSKNKREQIGEYLNIGFTNGKQLLKRLQQFHIKKDEFEAALRFIERKQ